VQGLQIGDEMEIPERFTPSATFYKETLIIIYLFLFADGVKRSI